MNAHSTTAALATSAVVVGGSLGGLFHAVALSRLGVEVTVVERSAARPADRGAGIVLQPTVEHMLSEFCDLDARAVSVAVRHRQFVDIDGTTRLTPSPQDMISWGTIYTALRSALPDGAYLSGRTVENITTSPSGWPTVAYSSTAGDEHTTESDLVVIADGSASRHRSTVDPHSAPPVYAGYVAFRGVVDEADLPDELVAAVDGRFTFFDTPTTQFLCYFIPGPDGSAVGQRRLNWVWYRTADRAGLQHILHDVNGRSRASSLPAGLMAADVETELRSTARTQLPALCEAVVDATAEPFAQAITDSSVQRMRSGPLLLSGDAAFVVRPHTAASTEKAAADALTLAMALSKSPDLDTALNDWERARLAGGHDLYRHGRMLGRRFETAPTTAADTR